jgi:hypothetical protein
MAQPRITFFCDLEPEALQKLFADTAVIDDLLRLQAGVKLVGAKAATMKSER